MKKRTKTIIAVIAGAAILIGGIWMINESRYPNVPAFDDHFTREFLNKDKKVDDGFYEFKSKTGQYTMWFPEEYQLLHENEQQYVRDGDFYERWRASSIEKHKGKNQVNDIQVTFSEVRKQENEEFSVDTLLKRRFNVSKPEKIETDEARIYYQSAYIYFKGNEKYVINDKKKHVPNTYVAYVADKNSKKVIQLSFDSIGKNLNSYEPENEEWFIKILKNIHFNEENSNE
ncbi:hypothetical protein [Priestia megaterium]|uniref:hypothetical protein n=1 Tax=Priestia megaterium TaxID=1404 RepID=UPI00048B6DAF|nr:hypothetical protein [Priestia megaterium]PGR01906.1 hypothetical protein COA23_22205 [Priestia megaterium]TJZ35067.1 hypothetical protein FA002_21050 [Priestia megaterium]